MKELRSVKRWKTERLRAVAVSPDGTTIATGHGYPMARPDRVIVWDAATGTERERLPEYPYPIHAVAYSPDGSLLAYAGGGGSIRLWDVKASQQGAELQGPLDLIQFLAFSPDGTMLVAAGRIHQSVYVWDVAKGTLVTTLQGHKPFGSRCEFSPSGDSLAVGVLGGIKLWTVGKKRWKSTDIAYPPLWVDSVSFSPNGTKLAFSTRSDVATLALDDHSISRLSSLRIGGYKHCRFFPGTNLIVSCGFAIQQHEEHAQLCVWDADNAKNNTSTVTRWRCDFDQISWSRDGRVIGIADTKSCVSTWQADDVPDVVPRKREGRRKKE